MAEATQTTKPVTIKRLDDSTVSIHIVIPWKEVEKARREIIAQLIKQVEAPGFRKGTVPQKIAEEKINKERVSEETLKKVLPEAYVKAVTDNKIQPLINPRIHIEAFEEGTDLKFTAETAEEPQVDLKSYKNSVKDVTAKSKIIVPGKEEAKDSKPNLDEILEAVIKNTEVKVSKLLIEHEANRLLSGMLDELKMLGMTLDQYLASRGKTPEQLRAEYEEKAARDIKLEFVLRKIADSEKITASEQEIAETITKIQDPKQREEMQKNSYVVSNIIRQQKTIDFLSKI